jgi:hypothetical protein
VKGNQTIVLTTESTKDAIQAYLTEHFKDFVKVTSWKADQTYEAGVSVQKVTVEFTQDDI